MPESTMHPLMKEGIKELQSGLEKVLTVLGAALTETPLTKSVEKLTAATAAEAAPEKEPPKRKAPASASGLTKQDIRKELQVLPRKVGIGLLEEFVESGNAIISNVPVGAYDDFMKAIKQAQKQYPDK